MNNPSSISEKPKVSVCIPIYNGVEFLQESLESVINQSYENLQILVVDDCSSDSGLELVERFAKKDPRIEIFRNQKRAGLVANWNKCLQLAEGDWIKLHFQDDTMHKDCIREMVTFGLTNKCGLVITDRKYIYEDGISDSKKDFFELRLKKIDSYIEESRFVSPEEVSKIFYNDFLGINFLGEPIVGLIRRDMIEKYGNYDTSLTQVSDFEFWLRISLNEGLGFIKRPLNHFRVHESSQTKRNSINRGTKMSPAIVDRVNLGLKMLNEEPYKKFRDISESTTKPTVKHMVMRKFTDYMSANGYFRSLNIFGPWLVTFFIYSPVNIVKAIYQDFAFLYKVAFLT